MNTEEIIGNSIFYDKDDDLNYQNNIKSQIISTETIKNHLNNFISKCFTNKKKIIKEQYNLEDVSNNMFETKYCKELEVRNIIFFDKKNIFLLPIYFKKDN